jgi:hypothetical protein
MAFSIRHFKKSRRKLNCEIPARAQSAMKALDTNVFIQVSDSATVQLKELQKRQRDRMRGGGRNRGKRRRTQQEKYTKRSISKKTSSVREQRFRWDWARQTNAVLKC